jgi:hypothetical protein
VNYKRLLKTLSLGAVGFSGILLALYVLGSIGHSCGFDQKEPAMLTGLGILVIMVSLTVLMFFIGIGVRALLPRWVSRFFQ